MYQKELVCANLIRSDLVKQRFEELERKASDVWASKKLNYEDKGVKHYKIPRATFREWGTNVLNLLQRVFGGDSIHCRNFLAHYNAFTDYDFQFEDCRAIFKASKEDYEGGYLFNIRGLIQAEVFDDALEQAKALLNAEYKDAACVIAGVVLETTLKELCKRNGIPTNKLDRSNHSALKVQRFEQD